MFWPRALLGASALVGAGVLASASSSRCFPDGFMFGSATASYQVEGGWNETGRTPSIWDDFCREKEGVQCANVADDFLHRYKDDIQTMTETGLKSFRFSISWSRVMNWDTATKRMVRNQPGIDFYHSMIDELLRNKLVPILTLYHWDLPSELHRKLTPQGWLNSEITDHFTEYVELVYREFGRKVDYWTTFNEPVSFVAKGYGGTGMRAPGIMNSDTKVYIAGHNVLISHAKAVAKFRELKTAGVFSDSARIGIVLVSDYAYPLNATDPSDVAAAKRHTEFMFGWFLQPTVTGDYPAIMRERAGDRLPSFTEQETKLLKGSYDLFMMNYYSSKLVTDCSSKESTVECSSLPLGWERDLGVDSLRLPPGARQSSKNAAGQLNCPLNSAYAPGYLEQIKWLHRHDPTADILLTENGWCGNEEIENEDQLWYYQTHLDQVHKAITEEKIPVIGYTAWSLLDNYEWGSFNPRFGLYYVNFTSQTGSKEGYTPKPTDLARIPRLAGRWFTEFMNSQCLADTDATMTEVLQANDVDVFSSHDVSVVVALGLMVAVALVAMFSLKRRAARTSHAYERSPLLQTVRI